MSWRSALARIPGLRGLYRRTVGAFDAWTDRKRPAPPQIGPDDWPTPQVRRDIARLRRNNRFSRRSIIDSTSTVVVGVTTHGSRISDVYLPIESVARGELRPRRHILFLDDPALVANLPRSLRRLRRRGLEIVSVPHGLGVHTKHYFYVTSSARHEFDYATHDDDIIYSPDWLASMLEARRVHPDAIVTPRAHRVVMREGRIAPYRDWVPALSAEPSYLHFGTTVSGQLYPPAFLDYVREQGEAFREVTPDNDDVWLHRLAVHSGRRVAQTSATPVHYPFVPGSQATGLWVLNVVEGKNDTQIADTYDASDLATLNAEDADYG